MGNGLGMLCLGSGAVREYGLSAQTMTAHGCKMWPGYVMPGTVVLFVSMDSVHRPCRHMVAKLELIL